MAVGHPQLLAGDRGSSSSSSSSHPPPPPPPKILPAKPPLPPPSASGADNEGAGGGGARVRQGPNPGSLSLLSDAWEVHTNKILPEYFKFLNKYLATFDGSADEADAIGAAKEEAAAAIIEFVKSADLYQESSLQKLQGFSTGEVQSKV
ncbi:hypothetical protein ZWY2020_056871 [Hordeum vulgare]|nr:hypothetical protein ZWY2020_056871 [Hordeum vulgare]